MSDTVTSSAPGEAASTPAPVSPGEGAPTPSSDTAQTAAGTKAPEAKLPEGASASGATGSEPKGQEPPKVEDFSLAFPDGLQGDPAFAQKMTELAKKSGVNKAQAEGIFNGLLEEQKKVVEAFTKEQEAWISELKADKDIGGINLDKNLAFAKKAAISVGGEDFAQLLHDAGLGNNPQVVRALVKVGKMLSEDSIANAGQKAPPAVENPWVAIYDKSPGLTGK